jgi:hypothetical protein
MQLADFKCSFVYDCHDNSMMHRSILCLTFVLSDPRCDPL